MKSFKDLAQEIVNKVDEDAPANAVGTGANVAYPPTNEPGVIKNKNKKHDPILINNLKRKVQENNDNNSVMLKGVLDKLQELDDIVDEASGVEKELVGEQEFQNEYATFKDRYMGQILYETDTAAAKQMEFLLVKSNGGNVPIKSYGAVKSKMGRNSIFKDVDELGKYIIDKAKSIKSFSSGGSMIDSARIDTANWKGRNKTPKTDIKLGNHKVSLKTGSAQLMSGGPDESISTYYVAMRKARDLNDESKRLAEEIEQGIQKLLPSTVGQYMGGVDIQKLGGTVYKNTKAQTGKLGDIAPGTFDKDKILKDADDHNLRMKEKFRQLFSKSTDFKKHFTFEAMTGKVKFADGDGTADHFLVCDYKGSASYHEVTSADDPYVMKILSQVNPDVKFKSTAVKKTIDGVKDQKTGHYRFWSVVSLGYKAVTDVQEEVNKLKSSGQVLTEGLLDRIKRALTKVTAFIRNLFVKMVAFLKDSVVNIQNFLGLEPQISFNNTIRW